MSQLAIGLFHSHSITTSCVGIDLVFILNWFYNITRLLKRCCVCLDILLHINFCNNFFTIILLLLLLRAGDVERNSGPDQTTHDLSILQLNIRSIRNKLDFIKDNFMDSSILCFTETHLDINIQTDFLHIPDYSETYRKDRNCHGGGILMYLNSELVHNRKTELEVYWDESIRAEIKVKNTNFLIGLYYSPKPHDLNFFNCLNLNIEKALEVSKNFIILGDMNEDHLNPNFRNLKDVLTINSLQNVVLEPTRLGAILDPILISEDINYIKSGVISMPSPISDHKATFINLPFSYQCQSSYERLVWMYKLLKQKIQNYDWTSLSNGSLDEACNLFTNTFLNFVKESIPSKLITARPNDKPWYDSEIRHFSRVRDRLKRKFNSYKKSEIWIQYKRTRNKVNNHKKQAKETFFNTLEVTITDSYDNDKRKFWKIVRHQMSFCKTEVNRESDDGIESLYQSKIDSSLNTDSKVKEGVCYFLKSRLPTAEGTVNSRKVEVLRDTGCTCCTVKRSLVSDDQLIGKESYVTLIDETAQKYPLAVIDVDCPFFTGKTGFVHGRYTV